VKKFKILPHARLRMMERGADEEEVIETLKNWQGNFRKERQRCPVKNFYV